MAEQAENREMDALKKDLEALKEEIRLLAGSLKEAGMDQARVAYWRARASGEEAVSAVSQKVEEKPLTSVLTALGIGVLIGLVLNRRSH